MFNIEKIILLSLSFLILINASDNSLKCGNNTINHCIECKTNDNSFCSRCEDKYFLYYVDGSCIPCNDPTYGQIGCSGNCNGNDYDKTKFALCEKEGCKEGYYNLEGICFPCNIGYPGCAKCSYEIQEESSNENVFICNECGSNEYILTPLGTCEKCKISNCDKCHYNIIDNNSEQICDKCSNGYYKNSNGKCSLCRTVYKGNGYCLVCSDNDSDYENDKCWCYEGHTFVNGQCIRCHENCDECLYNETLKDTICIKCSHKYALSKDKKCIYCGDGCSYCFLDEQNNVKECISCHYGKLLPNNKCATHLDGCENFKLETSSENKNNLICTQCYTRYSLNQEKGCTNCENNADAGYYCDSCEYNDQSKKFECFECLFDYGTYVTNTHKCYSNSYKGEKNFYGCTKAEYIQAKDNYDCLECKNDFILIENDKICEKVNIIGLSSYCLQVENLRTLQNPLYSCLACGYNSSLIIINNLTNKKDCFKREKNLSYCLEGKIDNKGNYICTKCVNHASLNISGICECNIGYFGKNNQWCYKCDDEINGNQGCIAKYGCSYKHSNDEIDCNQCKEGYFEYTKGQCYNCRYEIPNCGKCYIDNYNFKCDSCIDIYSWNNENEKCELNECEEYPEISPGCIICKDKLNEYKSKNKCQTCKYGYFKTKDELCIYCKSEK